jgi:glutamate/tyrosine decarboxylase-like PLP-dependent enzyme
LEPWINLIMTAVNIGLQPVTVVVEEEPVKMVAVIAQGPQGPSVPSSLSGVTITGGTVLGATLSGVTIVDSIINDGIY